MQIYNFFIQRQIFLSAYICRQAMKIHSNNQQITYKTKKIINMSPNSCFIHCFPYFCMLNNNLTNIKIKDNGNNDVR